MADSAVAAGHAKQDGVVRSRRDLDVRNHIPADAPSHIVDVYAVANLYFCGHSNISYLLLSKTCSKILEGDSRHDDKMSLSTCSRRALHVFDTAPPLIWDHGARVS